MFCFVMVTVVCYDLPIQTKGWHSKGYIAFFLADDVSASKIGAWPRAARGGATTKTKMITM